MLHSAPKCPPSLRDELPPRTADGQSSGRPGMVGRSLAQNDARVVVGTAARSALMSTQRRPHLARQSSAQAGAWAPNSSKVQRDSSRVEGPTKRDTVCRRRGGRKSSSSGVGAARSSADGRHAGPSSQRHIAYTQAASRGAVAWRAIAGRAARHAVAIEVDRGGRSRGGDHDRGERSRVIDRERGRRRRRSHETFAERCGGGVVDRIKLPTSTTPATSSIE